ncbi:hypothetical protein PCASD_11597 [Puccinia coronata f. sp. avenae]|uniref:Uncharacterized protein n=1 Tax=Puccinia coronata f. sp. avenae TaxID=200324 RepID=A0A2N5U8X6_9BASI|nr:hypothetical protein PCASD_11597 [Puccinia coronata f. sp. avenae]
MYRLQSSNGPPSNHSISINLKKAGGFRHSNHFDDPSTPTNRSCCVLVKICTFHCFFQRNDLPLRVEHSLDPHVTPSRHGGRSYTHFVISPMLEPTVFWLAKLFQEVGDTISPPDSGPNALTRKLMSSGDLRKELLIPPTLSNSTWPGRKITAQLASKIG